MKIANVFAVIYMVSIFSFPRSYMLAKMFIIGAYLLLAASNLRSVDVVRLGFKILVFYLIVILLGLTWSLVGTLYGHPVAAINDSLRLYVYWSVAFVILLSLLDKIKGRAVIHYAIVISGLIIFLINGVGMADVGLQIGLINEEFRKEMELNIGFHDGYTQIMSNNMGSLFFVCPYLYVYLAHNEANKEKNKIEKIALFLALVTAVASGRRALWICLLTIPVIDYLLNGMWGTSKKTFSRKIVIFYLIISPVILLYMLIVNGGNQIGAVEHLVEAFSEIDERSIQLGYLLNGYIENVIIGSGFGGYAGYTRSETSPWMYELTYWQIIYNFGTLGSLLIIGVFSGYLMMAYKQIGKMTHFHRFDKALFVGVISLLVGAYSNPYLGSFDFLFMMGVLPYLTQKINVITR